MPDGKEEHSAKWFIKRVIALAKPYLGLLGLVMLLNLVYSTLTALSILLVKPIFQILFGVEAQGIEQAASFLEGVKIKFYAAISSFISGGSNDMKTALLRFSLLLIIIFILKNIFKYLSSIVGVKFEEGLIKSIRDKVFTRLTALSVDFFDKSKQGTLISIITNDVQTLNQTTLVNFSKIIRESLQVALFILALLSISANLTLIAFSTSILSLFIIRMSIKYLRRYASRMQNAMADYTNTLSEIIAGIRVVKAYNAEEAANTRFTDDSSNYVKYAIKHKKVISLIPSINEVFAIVALCVVLYVGGMQTLDGSMTPDDLMQFLFTLFAIMSPINSVTNSFSLFQRGFVSIERVFKIIDEEPTVKSGKEEISKMNNKISVENITFAYDKENVIQDVSFDINKTRKIAFVGPSGSGKSTMLDLIIRFYDPRSGRITIDGTDIKNYDLVAYRELFGFVSQDTMLFNDTVENNIKYGYPNATLEEIKQAAKISNAYDFIMELPKGFQTQIGDRGINLSGGQRQRLAIARALVRNPQILVFDEATSSLDSESEKIVQSAINNSLSGRTAIIVAHRLATIIDCDDILVFESGKIIERGNHKELLELGGLYKNLYDIQFDS